MIATPALQVLERPALECDRRAQAAQSGNTECGRRGQAAQTGNTECGRECGRGGHPQGWDGAECVDLTVSDGAEHDAFVRGFCKRPTILRRLRIRGLSNAFCLVEAFRCGFLAGLEELDLSGNQTLSFSESLANILLPFLAERPHLAPELRVVRIARCEQYYEMADRIGAAAVAVVRHNRRLQALDLSGIRFGPEIGAAIAAELQFNEHLQYLGKLRNATIECCLARNRQRHLDAVWIKNVVLHRSILKGCRIDPVIDRVCGFLFPHYHPNACDLPKQISGWKRRRISRVVHFTDLREHAEPKSAGPLAGAAGGATAAAIDRVEANIRRLQASKILPTPTVASHSQRCPSTESSPGDFAFEALAASQAVPERELLELTRALEISGRETNSAPDLDLQLAIALSNSIH